MGGGERQRRGQKLYCFVIDENYEGISESFPGKMVVFEL